VHFFILEAIAQIKNATPVLYSITEQNGLSDDVVTCFYQDSRGFMWIGTQDGLNEYDGSAIKYSGQQTIKPRMNWRII